MVTRMSSPIDKHDMSTKRILVDDIPIPKANHKEMCEIWVMFILFIFLIYAFISNIVNNYICSNQFEPWTEEHKICRYGKY